MVGGEEVGTVRLGSVHRMPRTMIMAVQEEMKSMRSRVCVLCERNWKGRDSKYILDALKIMLNEKHELGRISYYFC
jgi:hypothetical protein